MYVYTGIRTHADTDAMITQIHIIHTSTSTCLHLHMQPRIRIHTHMCVCAHVHVQTGIHIHKHINVHIHMHLYVHTGVTAYAYEHIIMPLPCQKKIGLTCVSKSPANLRGETPALISADLAAASSSYCFTEVTFDR